MFFDTELNSASTVLKNVHKAFTETATKMWAYARCLPTQKQPSPKLIICMLATPSLFDSRFYSRRWADSQILMLTFLFVFKGTIQKLVDTAYLLLVSKTRKLRYPGYVCDVKKCEVSW
jgi:telomerase reverse transcriptase